MVKIALVGILGFGKNHLSSIQACESKGLCSLDSLVIVDMDNSLEALQDLLKKKPGLRVFSSLESLIKNNDPVDLICLPTGIGSHKYLSILSLKAGYNVLCEKPAAGSFKDALSMAEAERESGKILSIGYQNIFSSSIQKIKDMVLAGRLGALLEARTIVGWPRYESYYSRNSWAGRISDKGEFIFDSPLQNGAAHFLQNMLYIAGKNSQDCCRIQNVYGENYHVNDIDSADTQYIRIHTEEGALLNMAASHGLKSEIEPRTLYQFEKGSISWSNLNGKTEVFDLNGKRIKQWDNGSLNPLVMTFENTIESVKRGSRPLSDIGNALVHSLCLDAQYRCMNPISSIDQEYKGIQVDLGTEGDNLCYIKNLEEALFESYESGSSFFEMDLPWASQGKNITIGRL